MSRRVAIAGVGYSHVARHTGLSEREHGAQAALAALDDAGLLADQVDGVTTYGCEPNELASQVGMMPLSYHLNVGPGPAFVSPAINAYLAVAEGQSETCMAFRVMMQQPSSSESGGGAATLTQYLEHLGGDQVADAQFEHPYGSFSPTQWAAMYMNRYLHESDTTEEHFAEFAVIQREYAAQNADALQRAPITVDDYWKSPFVSEPLRLLDCDYPCDSAGAVIFTTEERARDLRQPVVLVESSVLCATENLSFALYSDMARSAPEYCAELLWSKTDLGPSDVDCAQLYDGFSFIALQWLEALGLCERGQAGPFIAAGNTRPGGSLPMNTDGGACNVGRRHGTNFCIEATRQLRGQGGATQVPDAEVSVWTNAVGPFAGAMLLTKG